MSCLKSASCLLILVRVGRPSPAGTTMLKQVAALASPMVDVPATLTGSRVLSFANVSVAAIGTKVTTLGHQASGWKDAVCLASVLCLVYLLLVFFYIYIFVSFLHVDIQAAYIFFSAKPLPKNIVSKPSTLVFAPPAAYQYFLSTKPSFQKIIVSKPSTLVLVPLTLCFFFSSY